MKDVGVMITSSKIVMCSLSILCGLLVIGAGNISRTYQQKMTRAIKQKNMWRNTVFRTLFAYDTTSEHEEWIEFVSDNPQLMLKATTDYYIQK